MRQTQILVHCKMLLMSLTPSHYFLRASSEFQVVAASAEKALRSLSYEFLQNRTKKLVELEVTAPKYFRVVIEKRSDPEVRNLIIPSIKEAKGTSIDVWLNHDGEEIDDATSNAKLFLKTLLTLLPVAPWIGLRFQESGKEKKKWREFTC